jgi:hypothetical protein
MKLIMSLVFLLALFATMINPINIEAGEVQQSQDVVLIAQQVGQSWVNEITTKIPELSEWIDATVSNPRTYFNLNNDVVGYLFDIVGNRGKVGYILIGGSLYGYPIFKAGTSSSPDTLDTSMIISKLKAKGIHVNNSELTNPDELLLTSLGVCLTN